MDDAGPGDFAVTLRRLRDAAALTQEELAERAGLTAKAIGALERGERRRPYPHTVRSLAEALGLDAAAAARLAAAARPAGPAPSRLPSSAPSGLPSGAVPAVPPNPLVGRERELDEVTGLLRGEARLVTLTGPGGVGKTRLALAVATRPDAEDPVLVELAGLHREDLVIATLARALGLQRSGSGDPVDELAGYLRDARRLVVLDNLEHLLGAAPQVADLLARSPGLRVLATSRAPLRVRAEQEYPVGPLPVPSSSDPAAVEDSPAARMFAERVRAVVPGFALDAATAPAVAAICRRLDGLPLALELAAVHARFLPPAELLERLDDALGGRDARPGARDLPERQRTMHATLDWSHQLLTAEEQVLLRRLSVFAAGFELDAVPAVAGTRLAALGGLVEQSLVVAGPGSRYRMLEPVRQYASARLEAAGETAGLQARHATHLAALAASATAELRGPGQARWLDRLTAEHENLRAALGTLLDTGRGAEAAAICAAIWPYWALRGHVAEALTWVRRVLAAGLDADADADAQLALAGLCYAAGDMAGTRDAAAVAGTGAEALVLLGSALLFTGEPAAASTLQQAEAAGRRAGDGFAVVHARIADAQRLLLTGDLDAASAVLARAERAAVDTGPFSRAVALNLRGTLARLAGRDGEALAALVEAGELAVQVGTSWTLVYTLPGLAVLVAGRDDALAAELFAAGAATAEATSLAVAFPPDREAAADRLRAVRAGLGDAGFEAARQRGRTLPPAALIERVRRLGPR